MASVSMNHNRSTQRLSSIQCTHILPPHSLQLSTQEYITISLDTMPPDACPPIPWCPSKFIPANGNFWLGDPNGISVYSFEKAHISFIKPDIMEYAVVQYMLILKYY